MKWNNWRRNAFSILAPLFVMGCSSPENNYVRGRAALDAIRNGETSIRHWEDLANAYENADASYGVLLIRGLHDVVASKNIPVKNIVAKLNSEEARVISEMMDSQE